MELLTRKEAAEYLGLSLRKLGTLAADGVARRVDLGEEWPRSRGAAPTTGHAWPLWT